MGGRAPPRAMTVAKSCWSTWHGMPSTKIPNQVITARTATTTLWTSSWASRKTYREMNTAMTKRVVKFGLTWIWTLSKLHESFLFYGMLVTDGSGACVYSHPLPYTRGFVAPHPFEHFCDPLSFNMILNSFTFIAINQLR